MYENETLINHLSVCLSVCLTVCPVCSNIVFFTRMVQVFHSFIPNFQASSHFQVCFTSGKHVRVMHQSFVSPAPPGPGNGGAFNFSFFKSPGESSAPPGKICGKIPAKSPGSPEADNSVEQQLRVVLMKLKHERRALICAWEC